MKRKLGPESDDHLAHPTITKLNERLTVLVQVKLNGKLNFLIPNSYFISNFKIRLGIFPKQPIRAGQSRKGRGGGLDRRLFLASVFSVSEA